MSTADKTARALENDTIGDALRTWFGHARSEVLSELLRGAGDAAGQAGMWNVVAYARCHAKTLPPAQKEALLDFANRACAELGIKEYAE